MAKTIFISKNNVHQLQSNESQLKWNDRFIYLSLQSFIFHNIKKLANKEMEMIWKENHSVTEYRKLVL
jgi:hypothetical protein